MSETYSGVICGWFWRAVVGVRAFREREYLSAPVRVGWKGTRFCRRVFCGAKRALLRVCTKSGIVPARPGPTRPGPARPAISATRLPALKMADLGPSVFPESGPARRWDLG